MNSFFTSFGELDPKPKQKKNETTTTRGNNRLIINFDDDDNINGKKLNDQKKERQNLLNSFTVNVVVDKNVFYCLVDFAID